MKQSKKALSILLWLALSDSLSLSTMATPISDFSYTTIDKRVTIHAYRRNDPTVTVPNDINGVPVTTIAPFAFENKAFITTLNLPANLKVIGDDAFNNCQFMTGVTLEQGLTTMGKNAFRECHALTAVSIPASISTVPDGAFFNYCTSLSNLFFPQSLTIVGKEAFAFANSLRRVIFGTEITNLGVDAFVQCGELSKVLFRGAPPAGININFSDMNPPPTVYYTPYYADTWNGEYNFPTALWSLQITGIRLAGGECQLSLYAPVRSIGRILYSDTLPPQWQQLRLADVADDTTSVFIDSNAPASRFYCVDFF